MDDEQTDEELEWAEGFIETALVYAKRRLRVCKQAPCCPKCRTRQVQIIDSEPLAKWKCRHCKHTWRFEPLVSNASFSRGPSGPSAGSDS